MNDHRPIDAPATGPSPGPRRRGDGPLARLADDLQSLAVHLHRALRRAGAPRGVSAAQLSALKALVDLGAQTIGELAEVEQVSAPTMTRLVHGLEAVGRVVWAPVPRDRRAVRVAVTRRGRALLRAQRARAIEELALRVRDLGPGDLADLVTASRLVSELLLPRTATGGAPRPEEAPLAREEGSAHSPSERARLSVKAPDGVGGSP
jgi:DNA-binding MarR family transcriptional regulator